MTTGQKQIIRGNNRVLRQDESGTYYRDIAFVPSGTLAMKEAAATTAQTNKEDAVNIREFYKTVLAMPRTVTPVKRKKQRVAQGGSGTDSNQSSTIAKPESTAAVKPSQSSSSISATPSTLQGSSSATEAAEIIRRNWQNNQDSTRAVADGHVLCESCQIEVRKDDLERHRRGTAHLISQESPIKHLDTLALGHKNKGFRMLVNSGWDYEKGLGAEGQGARHPVATRLKHDRLALGAAGTSKKLVTHTFEEIEKSRTKPREKSYHRVPLSLEDHRLKAEKERRDRVTLMTYMKK